MPIPDEKWVEELDRRLDEEAAAKRVSADDEEEGWLPSQRTVARFYYLDGLHWLEKTPPTDQFAKVVRPVREGDSEEFPVEWNNYVQRQRWVRNRAGPGPLLEPNVDPNWPLQRFPPPQAAPTTTAKNEVTDYDLLPDED